VNINTKFDFGDTVYLKTDPDQLERIVTGFSVKPNSLCYSLCHSTTESWHWDFEITKDRDILKTTTN